MIKPLNPSRFIGAKIIANDRRIGTIESIGKLSDEPWVMFANKNQLTRCSWGSIKLL
jgi:hypothetical protein